MICILLTHKKIAAFWIYLFYALFRQYKWHSSVRYTRKFHKCSYLGNYFTTFVSTVHSCPRKRGRLWGKKKHSKFYMLSFLMVLHFLLLNAIVSNLGKIMIFFPLLWKLLLLNWVIFSTCQCINHCSFAVSHKWLNMLAVNN